MCIRDSPLPSQAMSFWLNNVLSVDVIHMNLNSKFICGILRTLRVFELKKGKNAGELTVAEKTQTLETILKECLKLNSVTLIQCGGKDMIVSEREQWNDGSNTLCVEPGKVVVYDRNYVTNQILRENGITVLEMPSSELSSLRRDYKRSRREVYNSCSDRNRRKRFRTSCYVLST